MIPHIYEVLIKDDGQDIAEYAVMLAVILVIVVERYESSARTPTMCSRRLQARSIEKA